ncbi:MAG TPA: hypothetical protein GXX75_25510 [Clostridiales bacterium]|nr:hypothetical protein [Clostridiales bacterium]
MGDRDRIDKINGLARSHGDIKDGKGKEDLIIEENTVYEIDRECYERMRRQKKRKQAVNKSNRSR